MSAYGRWDERPDSVELLKKRLRENRTNGVFLFWGEEEYTKDSYAERLRKSVKSSPLPEFNYIILDAETCSPGDLEEASQALPYLWDSKLVEVRNLHPAKLSAEDGEQYARILSALPDYLTVLFLLRAGDYSGDPSGKKPAKEGTAAKKNGFSALFSAAEENGLAVEFRPEKGAKLEAWVAKHFAARGAKTENGLPGFLISYCGSDMYTLQGEIAKLCELDKVRGGFPLTEADVRTYCCPNESFVFFDVADCLNRGDAAGARRILSGLRLTPESVPMAIGYLASNYQLMLLVKAGTESGKTVSQIAAEQKLPAWKVSRALSSLRSVTAEGLNRTAARIAETDLRLKTTRCAPDALLETLICRIFADGKA